MANSGDEIFLGYPVHVRRFDFAGRTFELLGPRNYEALIDDPRVVARFQVDEFLPYWAEFWPACLLLADIVAAWPPARVQGRQVPARRGSEFRVQDGQALGVRLPRVRDSHLAPTIAVPARRDSREALFVLELGAGLGLVSLIACHLGYRVLCSDYENDALTFVRESARRNGIPPPETRYIDWRERYDDLRFDRIIAAEILYEKRNLQPIAAFLANHLKPDGEAIIVDRNRPTADAFAEIARAVGLSVEITPAERPGWNDDKPICGRVFRLWRIQR